MAFGRLIPVTLLLGLLLLLITTPADTRRVGVGVFLQNAAQIDILNGLYIGEALLYFYEDDNATFIPQTPFIANYGGSPNTQTILPMLGATNIVMKLIFSPNPTNYPFDTQNLELAIEDASGTSIDDLQYYWLANYSGVSNQLRLRGWQWDSQTTGTGVSRTHTYFGDKSVSQFSWTFTIKRPNVVAVQVLLPPFFVLISVLISFIMPITSSIPRIGIVGSALISEVSLHSGIKNANGTAGTLGLIDYFFILTYCILVISLSINVLVMILLRKNDKSPLAKYLESRTKYFVWLVCPGLYTFIFFRGSIVYAAVICLVCPLILYVVIERTLPRIHAWRRKFVSTQKKKKEDTIYGDEENEAKLQDGEGQDGETVDSKRVVVDHEMTVTKRRMTMAPGATDSYSIDMYDTDSE